MSVLPDSRTGDAEIDSLETVAAQRGPPRAVDLEIILAPAVTAGTTVKPSLRGAVSRTTSQKLSSSNKNLTEHLDVSKAKRPMHDVKRVNVDFPKWMVRSLDKEASRLGVTRQSVIKMWLAERLQAAK